MLTEKIHLDINEIIANEEITIYFQPIVSLVKKSVIGMEALCRGIYRGELVNPNVLFNLAASQGVILDLDRLCRRKALEKFSHNHNKELMLFLNFDTSIIDKGVVGSGQLINTVKEFGLQPDRIIIEIIESKVRDVKSLSRFIETYRNHGFMIALDDVGAGYSNLNRIVTTKPDILKIDRSIIDHIDEDFYKQEVLRSMVKLSRKVGCLVVAEGIKREEEAIISLDIGVDMLQGFFFAMPQTLDDFNAGLPWMTETQLDRTFKEYMMNKTSARKSRNRELDGILTSILTELANMHYSEVEDIIPAIINRFDSLECIYILDEYGFQISETVLSMTNEAISNNAIFQPAPKGTDHSLKDYYYQLLFLCLEKYHTEPYVSLASGNLCITISAWMRNSDGIRRVLCLDIRTSSKLLQY
ncbi:MAG: EAL domain-containing protein [Desulfosporosinus sp.]